MILKSKYKSASMLEKHFWKKAYVTALHNGSVKNLGALSANAKLAADQYTEDYKVRAPVAEFQAQRDLWGAAYFAVIGRVPAKECGEIADAAITNYDLFKVKKVVDLE